MSGHNNNIHSPTDSENDDNHDEQDDDDDDDDDDDIADLNSLKSVIQTHYHKICYFF
jgi:hypothetical protein